MRLSSGGTWWVKAEGGWGDSPGGLRWSSGWRWQVGHTLRGAEERMKYHCH